MPPWASTNPASTRCWSTSTALPTTGNRPDSTMRASCCRSSGCPRRTRPEARTSSGVVAPDTTKPVQITMLWPLADKPRLAPGVPGGTTPVRLMDDDLATSLAAGGRLDTLLGAAEFATSPAVDPDGEVTRALCLAVDPDLLVTVNAMIGGYTVSDSHDGLGTASHPGTGQAAASAWLARLRALAGRMCVAAAPYAQADLDALQRVGDAALSAFTVNGAADLVEQILGVPTTRGATLVGDGPLQRPRRRLARRAGQHGGDRRRRLRVRRQRQRRRHDRRTGPAPAVTTGGRRPVRPRLWAPPWPPPAPTRCRRRISTVRSRCRCTTIHRSRVARTRWPRCCGAGLRPRDRTPRPDPDAAAGLEPATRRRAGRADGIRIHHPRRAGDAAPTDRGDRRNRGRSATTATGQRGRRRRHRGPVR